MQNANPAAELEQMLDQAAEEIIPEPPADDASEEEKQRAAGFRIDSEEKLAWATRKYAGAEQIAAEARQAAKAQIDRINAWLNKVTAEQNGRMEFFRRLCEEYLKQRQKDNKKLKGLPTPYGRVQARAQQPAWNVQNEAALVEAIKEWAVSDLRDELVRVKEEPALAAIKAMAKAGNHMRLEKIGVDIATELPIYAVQVRTVDGDGQIAWATLPGIAITDQPDKIGVEVGK